MAEALLITRNDVVKFTAMNGNVDTDSFIQFVKIAQDIHIQNFLGTDLLQKLQAEIILATSGIPTAITLTNAGTGYTTNINLSTTATTGNGSGLEVDITETGGIIDTVSIGQTAGTGYKVNDVIVINGGNDDAEISIDKLYSIPTDYNNLLVTYVKPMLIHWAMVEYLPFAAYTIANKGVYKHNSENATNVEKVEIDFLIEKERSIAQHYTERFIEHISFNNDKFPEYNSNSNGDMYPDTNNNYSPWYL
jgi:hypothetical protein